MNNHVEHPGHYEGHLECTLAERYSYTLGNAIKYVWRHETKGHPEEDLDKAIWYLALANRNQEPAVPTAPLISFGPTTPELLRQLADTDFAHAKPFWRCLLKARPIPELIQAIQKTKERQAWHER